MLTWILIGAGYVLVPLGFRFLGGFGSAGEALRSWGRASSRTRLTPGASS